MAGLEPEAVDVATSGRSRRVDNVTVIAVAPPPLAGDDLVLDEAAGDAGCVESLPLGLAGSEAVERGCVVGLDVGDGL